MKQPSIVWSLLGRLNHSAADSCLHGTTGRQLVRAVALVCFVALLLVTTDSFSADISAGQQAASQCNVCHGKNGLATNPEAPNLAGESAIYIEKQLMAFKTGERQHRQMSLVAQGLELETIRDLAAWYQAMIVTVELPALPQ